MLYQYKDGIQSNSTNITSKQWDPYLPLSCLAKQFPAFGQSTTFIQTTIPYPTQAPYLNTIHALFLPVR